MEKKVAIYYIIKLLQNNCKFLTKTINFVLLLPLQIVRNPIAVDK